MSSGQQVQSTLSSAGKETPSDHNKHNSELESGGTNTAGGAGSAGYAVHPLDPKDWGLPLRHEGESGLLVVKGDLTVLDQAVRAENLHLDQNYLGIWKNEYEAALASNVNQPTLILQTPRDGSSSCSLFLTKSVNKHSYSTRSKGVFVGNEIFALPGLLTDRSFLGGERSPRIDDLTRAIDMLPIRILESHVSQTRKKLDNLLLEISGLEKNVREDPISYNHAIRLYEYDREYMQLHRRWHFERDLGKAIKLWLDQTLRKSDPKLGGYLRPLQENAEQHVRYSLLSRYQYEVLPRKIDNLSAMIRNLTLQKDSHLSMRIAKSSAQIAEEARRDSSSMKTIATLTLVFLPATFVASMFSMSIFNWQAQGKDRVVSRYIWVYFAAVIPLTLVVLLVWLAWFYTSQKRHAHTMDEIESQVSDIESPKDK
ncbi:MAG: hypothetical protein M1840_006283 [Geoglossum simile]|nr:MAG: hypothetical protein M1840_006283 [Geoglossum simile]